MLPIDDSIFDSVTRRLGIVDVNSATIRQICAQAVALEQASGHPFVRLEIGNPGLQAESIGIKAECEAIASGIPNKYPDIAGIPQLKSAGADFVKAFIDIDLPPRCIVPTVGSMQASFTLMLLLGQRNPGRDTILYIDPGFPAQHHQAKVLGLSTRSFDIYEYRGDALSPKLEEMLADGKVAAIIYSNPNNPAWINLTDSELRAIGEAATKHDVIVIEDHAYMGMDFRQDLSHPGKPPYVPTVARYTDNYILLISASKIFSYAGQRIAVVAFSPAVFDGVTPALKEFYEMSTLGDCYVFGVLYTASSGTAHSAQFALAAMMNAAVDGRLDFVAHSREYGLRAARVKELFTEAGFNIIYSHDGDSPISDGFFFTVGYPGLTGAELHRRLMRCGISTIPLRSTGSAQEGLRVCVSMMTSDDDFNRLAERLKIFRQL